MTKKHNVIEINGRRYDASTGVPLDATKVGNVAAPTTPNRPVSIPVRVSKLHQTVPPHSTHTNRTPAKSLKSHAPQPARTLMRQAVNKPALTKSSPRLKVTGQLTGAPVHVSVVVKPSVSQLDASRLHRAKSVKHSQLITRFNRRQMWAGTDFVATTSSSVTTTPIIPPVTASKKSNHKPRTTADVLEMAIQNATSHLQPAVKPAKHHRVWHRRHAAAH